MSSQQHAASPASDQQTASLASSEHIPLPAGHPQMASPMQLDPDVLAGSQQRQRGPPWASYDTKGRVDMLAQQATEGGLSRLSSMGDDSGGVSLLGRQTAHLDQAACSERSANRLFCPHSAAARAQQAHAPVHHAVQSGQKLHSQHAAGAAPASAAQHLMTRPQAQARRGHIHVNPGILSAGHEQSSPGISSTAAGPAANQGLQHSPASHIAEQSGPSAASICANTASNMAAQMPGAVFVSQPRPVGPMGNLGRPAQSPPFPSSMQPTLRRQPPAPVMALHGQHNGASGPSAAHVPRSVDSLGGAGVASGVRPQRWPGQQTTQRDAGARMPGQACLSGSMPSQQGCMQTTSMTTAQHAPQPHAQQQQQHNSLPWAHGGQQQVAQHSSRAAVSANLHHPVPQTSGKAGSLQHRASENAHGLPVGQGSALSLESTRPPGLGRSVLGHPGAAHAARADQDAGSSVLLLLPDASGAGSRPAFLGSLTLNIMQSWVRKDLKAASDHLEVTRQVQPCFFLCFRERRVHLETLQGWRIAFQDTSCIPTHLEGASHY